MVDDVLSEGLSAEEAAFWRGFIEWWARERTGPVPARAWEALRRAEDLMNHGPKAMRGPRGPDGGSERK